MKRATAFALPLLAIALLAGCAATDHTIVLDPKGEPQDITQAEIDEMSGEDMAYLLQVGDKVSLQFHLREFREGDVPWDYRIEVGDNMEVRLTAPMGDTESYKIDVGDLIGISFLNNWPLNSNRTVRPDGYITMPEVGDIKAAGLTPFELRKKLTQLYAKTGIIEGEPRITVNVDFANPDRLENMSRDIVVRPDGKIRIPSINTDVMIAGMTVAEAGEAIKAEAAKVLMNKPDVNLIVFPAINQSLLSMNGVVSVRPDGRVSVPKIGELQAAGYSTEELRKSIKEACDQLAFNDVDISADVVQATGARIYIGGEVANNGVFPLEGAPSAFQAILMAGGPTKDSRLNSVLIIRRNPNGKPYVYKTNIANVLTGSTENDIMLRAFDVVYVPRKLISRANLFVEQYIEEIVPFENTMGVSGTYYLNEQKINSKSKNNNFSSGVTVLPNTGGLGLGLPGSVINP
ncbi:MAG TPA: polysaccharide biosynthesis/export family protein [Candidatus Hydrogenedentes bacterium]|nr:polysaccharide biosynthesis/export family protein [Candidatus Hydrogenedentota bacterium]